MKKFFSLIATLLVLVAAVAIGRQLWLHYMTTPWTRDGRVRADIINVAADVPGYVVDVPVKDNQRVKKGDLLIQIDPEHYQLAVDQAKALVASRKATWEMRKVNAKRRADMDNLVISKENRDDASNIANSAQADYQQALAELAAAELNLKRTHIVATVDGYVTNLNIHKGDYARTGEAVMAVVDENSFWVYGFFEETKLPHVKVGDQAELQMMSGERIKGHVESIARGIYDRDNPQSRELIADVNPTFNWVRLAQRVPVRIHIDEVPEGFLLAALDLPGGTPLKSFTRSPHQYRHLNPINHLRADRRVQQPPQPRQVAVAHDDQLAVQLLRLGHDHFDRLPGHHAALAGEAGLLQRAHGLGHSVVGMLLFLAGGGVFLQFFSGVGRGLVVDGEGGVDGQQYVQFVFAGAAVAASEGEQGAGSGGGVDGDQDWGGHAGSLADVFTGSASSRACQCCI